MSLILTPNAGGRWYANPSILADVTKLYLSTTVADVYFVIRNGCQTERIPAHKTLLAVKSDVFQAMFYGEMKETNDISIVDASVAAFKEFLQYFYLNSMTLTMSNVSDVVNLCKKYDIEGFLNICEKFLKDSLNVDNLCVVYSLAILFELDELKKMCKSMTSHNTEAIFKSTTFLQCDRSVLTQILLNDTLSCSELKVFDACMDWIKELTKQNILSKEMIRSHLGSLFYEIRFGRLTIEEFADVTSRYRNIFTLDEYQEIVQMIGSKFYIPQWFRSHRENVQPNFRFMKSSTFGSASVGFGSQATIFATPSIFANPAQASSFGSRSQFGAPL